MSPPVPITYPEAVAAKQQLEQRVAEASARLRAFPHNGPMGLTPDAVKASPEFRAAKIAFDAAFSRLRAFNSIFVRVFEADLVRDRARREREERHT